MVADIVISRQHPARDRQGPVQIGNCHEVGGMAASGEGAVARVDHQPGRYRGHRGAEAVPVIDEMRAPVTEVGVRNLHHSDWFEHGASLQPSQKDLLRRAVRAGCLVVLLYKR